MNEWFELAGRTNYLDFPNSLATLSRVMFVILCALASDSDRLHMLYKMDDKREEARDVHKRKNPLTLQRVFLVL